MDEHLIDKQIEMYSLVARMEQHKAIIKSMDADGNYAETSYLHSAQELEDIANQLKALSNS